MIIRLTIIAVLGLSLAACNPPASDGGDAGAAASADASGAANVDTPAPAGETSGRAIPAGFPAYLAPMTGATVTDAVATPDGQMVQYRINRPMDEVIAFHRAAATDAGVAPTEDGEVGQSHMLAYGQDHGFVISATPDGPGATRVSIANTLAPTE